MLVRVMTYNILVGGADRAESIRTIIRESRPDILVLEEVIDKDLPESIAEENGLVLAQTDHDGRRRVCILSRFPVKGQSTTRLSPAFRQGLRIDLDLGAVGLTVIGVHPIANPAWWFELLRAREAEAYLRLAKGAPNHQIIAGDMNAVAAGDLVRLAEYPRWLQVLLWLQGYRVYTWAIGRYLRAGYVDVYRALNPGQPGLTLPAHRPNTRLDYILASQRLAERAKSSWVVESPETVRRASDHLPVMAEFDL